jgi:Ca2+-binding RTX toxin-like protein
MRLALLASLATVAAVAVALVASAGATGNGTCFGLPATNPGSTTGTAGSDVIIGTGGDDIIDGRGGHDLICGGAGADNFKFAACAGHSVIGDFTSGQDHLDLSSIVTTNDVNAWIATHVTACGQDTLIAVDDDLTITLQNVRPTSLSSSDFIVHPNGSFN